MHDLGWFWNLNPESDISHENDGFLEICDIFPSISIVTVLECVPHTSSLTIKLNLHGTLLQRWNVVVWCNERIESDEIDWFWDRLERCSIRNCGATGLAKSSQISNKQNTQNNIRDLRWHTTLQLLTHSLCCLMPTKVLGDDWNLPCSLQCGKLTHELTDIHSIAFYCSNISIYIFFLCIHVSIIISIRLMHRLWLAYSTSFEVRSSLKWRENRSRQNTISFRVECMQHRPI